MAVDDILEHWDTMAERSKRRNRELAKHSSCPACGDIDFHKTNDGYFCLKCGHQVKDDN